MGSWSHDRERAHKEGMRIHNKHKKKIVFYVLIAKELMQKI
jgi:hypothetical protein